MQHDEKNTPEKTGGQGGNLLNDPGHIRADCKMIERYGFREDVRAAEVTKLVKIMLESNRNREVISAVRALTGLDKLNLEYMKEERARRLDIDPDVAPTDQAERIIKQIAQMEASMPGGDNAK